MIRSIIRIAIIALAMWPIFLIFTHLQNMGDCAKTWADMLPKLTEVMGKLQIPGEFSASAMAEALKSPANRVFMSEMIMSSGSLAYLAFLLAAGDGAALGRKTASLILIVGLGGHIATAAIAYFRENGDKQSLAKASMEINPVITVVLTFVNLLLAPATQSRAVTNERSFNRPILVTIVGYLVNLALAFCAVFTLAVAGLVVLTPDATTYLNLMKPVTDFGGVLPDVFDPTGLYKSRIGYEIIQKLVFPAAAVASLLFVVALVAGAGTERRGVALRTMLIGSLGSCVANALSLGQANLALAAATAANKAQLAGTADQIQLRYHNHMFELAIVVFCLFHNYWAASCDAVARAAVTKKQKQKTL